MNSVQLGDIALLWGDGAPVAGTSEVQRLTITGTPTGGYIVLKRGGRRTAHIAYNAAASAVQTALRALGNIGSAGVSCGGGALPGSFVTITYASNLGLRNVGALTIAENALEGGTDPAAAITTTTPGVDATGVGVAGPGSIYVDITNGVAYFNKGTSDAPDWNPAGGSQAAFVAPVTVADGAGTNDGTIAAITNNATTIAAVQELAAKQAEILTALQSAGLMAAS